MKRLQHKIFFFFVALLLVVQSVVLIANYRSAEQQKQQHIESRLETARSNFRAQFDNRRHYLGAFAETAARDFGLKQVFEEDTRSFLVALNNHRQRISADLAIAIRTDATIAGQLVNAPDGEGNYKTSVGTEQGKPFRFMGWFEMLDDSYLYALNGVVYQLSFAPLQSGDLIIGWVGFGYSLDQRLARQFAELTGLTTEFAVHNENGWQLLASSTPRTTPELASVDPSLLNRIMSGDQPYEVIATFYPLGHVFDRPMVAAMYGFRSDLLETIQDHWQWLLLLAGLSLLLSLAGAYWIAASISRPAQLLVRQAKDIAGGDYDRSIEISSRDELGQLALEFNQMKKAIVSREHTISRQAFHDTLTGLPNRHQLLAAIDELVSVPGETFALLRLAPQQIREVNYSLGHDVGDEVVSAIAGRLAKICEPGLLFNLGGSAFAMLLRGADDIRLQACLTALDCAMEPFIEVRKISLHIQVQAGIALFPEHDKVGARLLEMAGTALQHAQQSGQPRLVYDAAMSRTAVERLQLVNGLARAIEDDQLVLFYQPKLNLASGAIDEVEALVRWQHPDHGMVPPDRFIGLAEQTGHIHALTRWVFDSALHQHRAWRDQGIHLPIAVNLSAESLKTRTFYDEVVEALQNHDLAPDAIRFEVTESVVLDDPEMAVELLVRFRGKGFHLSVDDYGTGYSSLSQLKRLPVSELKIDKAFVMNLQLHKEDRVIVKSTIDLAHAMGMQVVAEGVEDRFSLEWLQSQGCELAQGYFICKPKPAGELSEWLRQAPRFNHRLGLVGTDQ